MKAKQIEGFADEIGEQGQDLCHLHEHVTRVITSLEIDADLFRGYDDENRARYDLEAIVRMYLYQHTRNFGQTALVRRLCGATFVYARLGLSGVPSQPAIGYIWRNRFSTRERHAIKQAAEAIERHCREHDLVDHNEPAPEPDEIGDDRLSEEQIQQSVQLATDLSFDEFRDPRASNIKYGLEAYFERQSYLNISKAGTTTARRRFARLSDRGEVPHGSSHTRTMKKIADPTPQTSLWDFEDGDRQHWKHIRDEILPAFHAGVENVLDEIAERDSSAVREPVDVAFDITTWPYWPSPYRDEEDVEHWEEPVELERSDGSVREVYPRDDYPELVSGVKESHERAFKFATLTIVPEDTPIIIAVEPVRDRRAWEPECVQTRTRGELVDRLFEQAERHVDINKVFADREFDSYEVRHVIDQHDAFYVIGKRKQSSATKVAIQETVEHEVADVSVEHGTLTYDGETHDVSFLYVPKDSAKDKSEYIKGDYAVFTINAHISPDRAMALTGQYRKRWTIENQYKSIKHNFLPGCATSDFRTRFLYFVVGVTLHNVWRLTNLILRDEVDADLGEDPPLPAGEIVELVGLCLFDPGG